MIMPKFYCFTLVVSALLFTACAESPPPANSEDVQPDAAANLADLPTGDVAIAKTPEGAPAEPDDAGEGFTENTAEPSDTPEDAGADSTEPNNDLATRPLTPGDWQSARGGIHFGEARSEPRFSMTCDPEDGQIVLYRAGLIGPDEQLQLDLFTESASAISIWQSESNVLPRMVARIPISDPVWPTVAVAERFGVGVASRPFLTLPVTDLVREFVTVCGTDT